MSVYLREQHLDLARELRKLWNIKVTNGNTNNNWCAWNDPRSRSEYVGGVTNQKTSRNYQNNSIVENTGKVLIT